MRGAAGSSGSSANSIAEYEAAGEAHDAITIGLMDDAFQTHPSIVCRRDSVLGAGSRLVLVLTELMMLLYSVSHLKASRAQQIHGALVQLYCDYVSPLVHVPRRRQALRWTLVLLLILAPAFPPVEINGWRPGAHRVIGNVLRIVSGARPSTTDQCLDLRAQCCPSPGTGTTPDSGNFAIELSRASVRHTHLRPGRLARVREWVGGGSYPERQVRLGLRFTFQG